MYSVESAVSYASDWLTKAADEAKGALFDIYDAASKEIYDEVGVVLSCRHSDGSMYVEFPHRASFYLDDETPDVVVSVAAEAIGCFVAAGY